MLLSAWPKIANGNIHQITHGRWSCKYDTNVIMKTVALLLKRTVRVLSVSGVTESLGGVSLLCARPGLVVVLSAAHRAAVRPAMPAAGRGGRVPGPDPHARPARPPDTRHLTLQLQGPPQPPLFQRRRRVQQFPKGADAPSAPSSASPPPPTPPPPPEPSASHCSATPSSCSRCTACRSGAATATQEALVGPRRHETDGKG